MNTSDNYEDRLNLNLWITKIAHPPSNLPEDKMLFVQAFIKDPLYYPVLKKSCRASLKRILNDKFINYFILNECFQPFNVSVNAWIYRREIFSIKRKQTREKLEVTKNNYQLEQSSLLKQRQVFRLN